MKQIIRRISRLEARRRSVAEGIESWPAREAEVRRRAFAPMSVEEIAWLNEIWTMPRDNARAACVQARRECWDRFELAFNNAVVEVPAPYAMCIEELFGED